ncbi:enoyl-CoA hydratase/isomerase family protein [Nocardia vinacea]|uniref:enoyl-CoA hydratase/isomerase family protein n=1 Tax=Nocardia vinacea TaxID=96468 RepID=UPI000306F3C5|nr:enoyl-CoA hydratase-related protein [Nocardia vinacea]
MRPRPILTLSGRRIDAAEALRIGLVAEVVPAAELMDIVGRLARDIARGPREALIRTKAKAVRRMGIDVGMATLAM